MEKEIVDLRKRLSNGGQPHAGEVNASDELSRSSEEVFSGPSSAGPNDRGRPLSIPVEQQPSLVSPLTAIPRHEPMISHDDKPWKLEDVSLSRGRVARLFEQ